MSEPKNRSQREQLEARLVALILGEASPFEEAELLEILSRDPELATFYRKIMRTTGLVQKASRSVTSNELSDIAEQATLSSERRQTLLALLE